MLEPDVIISFYLLKEYFKQKFDHLLAELVFSDFS